MTQGRIASRPHSRAHSSTVPPTMRAKVDAYLLMRRHAGFAMAIEASQLMSFARFAEAQGHDGPLTVDLACRWATSTTTCTSGRPPQAITSARRIEVLRSFARYWQLWEPETEIPPLRLFGPGHRRLTPHIYTEQEIIALLTAAAHLPPSGSLRAACCVAIFGLLAATGLRIAEAVSLMRSDVDLARGRLHIRQTKGGKARWVPLHATTTEALQQYAQRRDQDPRSVLVDAFFLGMHGRPAQCQQVQYAFRQLRQQLGWHARGGHPAPRIHDLRHTFICRRLERWYAEGRTIDHDILALTTYVGHAHVTSTYWYLTATPELMAIAAHRVEHVGAGSPAPRAPTRHRSAHRQGPVS